MPHVVYFALTVIVLGLTFSAFGSVMVVEPVSLFARYDMVNLRPNTKLTNADITDRYALGGVEYKVLKNTLAKRALKGTPFEPLSEHFVGTTAVAYSGDDPVALAKVLTTFAKTAPALQIKAAVVQGRIAPSRMERGTSSRGTSDSPFRALPRRSRRSHPSDSVGR